MRTTSRIRWSRRPHGRPLAYPADPANRARGAAVAGTMPRAGGIRIIAVNQLLYNHQLARMNAEGAGSARERAAHAALAGHYAAQIVAWRRDAGLSEAGWPGGAAPMEERED